MQLQELAQSLMALGLTEKQAKVYVANLFLGPVSAQKIAEQAGVNRPTAYDILEDLAQLGLVSRSNDGAKTVFIAANAMNLQDLLQRQADDIQQRQQKLTALLPQLQQIERAQEKASPMVRFVHGKDGVDAIRAYALRKAKPGSVILSLTNHDETLKVYPDQLKNNPSLRMSKRLFGKQFYYSSKNTVPSDPKLLKQTIRLEEPIKADVTLYEDSAVLLSYGKTPKGWTGILIESKDIVGVIRQLYDLAWKSNINKK